MKLYLSLIFILVVTFAAFGQKVPQKLAPVISGSYSQVLFFGNSITVHPESDLWWNRSSGMAATSPESDYVHILANRLRLNNPRLNYNAYYNAAWEKDFADYDLSNFDYQFNPVPDLVVIRLGENVSYTPDYDAAFLKLVDYVSAKAPNATIIITGSFWKGHEKSDAAQETAARQRKLLYVSLSYLDCPAMRNVIGATVSGSDGNSYQINRQGVADHPNDSGMRAIANNIYGAMYPQSRKTVRFF